MPNKHHKCSQTVCEIQTELITFPAELNEGLFKLPFFLETLDFKMHQKEYLLSPFPAMLHYISWNTSNFLKATIFPQLSINTEMQIDV